MGEKSLKKIAVITVLLSLLASCKQPLFQVLTHNDVGYWSRYWTRKDPQGSIIEVSKKDSIMRNVTEHWTYPMGGTIDDIYGKKIRITNDTLFTYVSKGNGFVVMRDTLPIVSYSRNTIILTNEAQEPVKWHRISTKYARRMINAPDNVKLSTALKVPIKKKSTTSIVGVVWKLYGYGDVSNGNVRKSASLKYDWMNVVKFLENGSMAGLSTHNDLWGEYILSDTNIELTSFDDGERDEAYDGHEFCQALSHCTKYKILRDSWLQLFYGDGKKFLLFYAS